MSSAPRCDSGTHCGTCTDEGIPMRVVALDPDGLARCVDAEGRAAEVETALVGPLSPGDRVLVHGGTALLRLAPPGAGA